MISREDQFKIAIMNGDIPTVKNFLAEPNFDINSELPLGFNTKGTALIYSCSVRQVEILKLLLADNRINVNKISGDGENKLTAM
jgi:hypothetical protein